MRRWIWMSGAVLALALAIGLLWPSAPTPELHPGAASAASPRQTQSGRVAGATPSEPSPRGGAIIRGVVQSLIGEPMPGVSIVALPRPSGGTSYWADTCLVDGLTARRAEDCEASFPVIEETLEAVQSRVPVELHTTSAADGTFELTGLREGVYEVWAEAPHGVAVRQVATGAEETRFVLEAGARLAGVARDEQEGPVAGASVVLLPRDFIRHFERVSGEDGRFTFGRVPTGTYRVLGVHDGLLPDMDEMSSTRRFRARRS